VLYQGADVPAFTQQQVVVGTVEADSPAQKSGILPGDHIIQVGSIPVETWEEFGLETVTKANRAVKLTIIRDGKTIEREVVPVAVGKYEEGVTGVIPPLRPQVASVQPGEPAEAAGLRAGDVILAVNAEKPIVHARVIEIIRANEGKPLQFEILRDGSTLMVPVTPKKFADIVRIGAQIRELEVRIIQPNLVEAFKLSAQRNYDWAKLIVRTLAGLFTRDTPVKQLMGPVAIAGLSGEAAQAGWIQLFSLMAMISLNLGLLNLMPIPVLDGGHITILALEGLSRRDFSMKVKEKMLLGGFVLLLMLMVTVIYNDLARIQWIQKLIPWR
jgi:regulator of sigma E protease